MMTLLKNRMLLKQAYWLFALVFSLSFMHSAQAETSEFDHFSTGFPLTGEHRNVVWQSSQ